MPAITDDEAFVLPVAAPVKRPTNLTLRRMVRDVCFCSAVFNSGSVFLFYSIEQRVVIELHLLIWMPSITLLLLVFSSFLVLVCMSSWCLNCPFLV